MKKSIFVVLLAISILLIGCKTVTTTSVNKGSFETQEIELSIEGKRGTFIPAVLTLPIREDEFALVIMAHGHSGSKEENGGFTDIANALAKNGIAVIRMDFPGCGESKESFKKNTIMNMIDDIASCKDHVIENYNVASNHIGLFGYSMGGRVVQSILNWNYSDDIKGVVLLAPAVDKSTMINSLGGSEAWTTLKASAMENGSVEFTTIYGVKLDLSSDWFEQLEIETPLQDAKLFNGIATVLYGEDDAIVNPLVSKSEAEKIGAKLVEVTGDSHSYGFYSDRIDIKQAVIDATVDTFIKAFSE